jgi:hypothetical protein
MALEQAWLDVVSNFSSSACLGKNIKIYWNAQRSFADALDHAVEEDYELFACGYILMLVYVALVLGRPNLSEIKVSHNNMHSAIMD